MRLQLRGEIRRKGKFITPNQVSNGIVQANEFHFSADEIANETSNELIEQRLIGRLINNLKQEGDPNKLKLRKEINEVQSLAIAFKLSQKQRRSFSIKLSDLMCLLLRIHYPEIENQVCCKYRFLWIALELVSKERKILRPNIKFMEIKNSSKEAAPLSRRHFRDIKSIEVRVSPNVCRIGPVGSSNTHNGASSDTNRS